MKKTLLAAALAVGFVGAAQAETSVTLYGIIDTGVAYEREKGIANAVVEYTGPRTSSGVPLNPWSAGNYDVVGSVTKRSRTGLYDGHNAGQAGSRWGLKGTEDLGNGLRAEFMLESGFNVGTGNQMQGGRLFGRQAWVGLAGDGWGSLRFGRQHNVGTDFMLGMIDPFGGGFGLAHPGAIFKAIDTNRMDNTIKYVTPNFSGFQAGVAYSFNHSGDQAWKDSGVKDSNNRAISAGLRYANGPIGVALTYDQMKNRSNTGFEDSTVHQWNIGGAYDFEVVKVSAAFGQTRGGAYAADRSAWGGVVDNTGLLLGYPARTAAVEYAATALGGINAYDKGFKANSYMVGLSAPVGGGTVLAAWAMMDPRSNPDRWSSLTSSDKSRISKKEQTYSLGYKYPLSKRTDVYAYAAHKKHVNFIKEQKATTVAAGLTHRF